MRMGREVFLANIVQAMPEKNGVARSQGKLWLLSRGPTQCAVPMPCRCLQPGCAGWVLQWFEAEEGRA